MEEMGESALSFGLYVHVPDPSLGGRVKHRIFRQIQQRFKEANFEIPLPTQELLVKALGGQESSAIPTREYRADTPSATPPGLWSAPPRPAPEPVEESHRGVDE